ncbi:hypothetical protein EMIT051CA3_21010 [Pseudomonas chlororaphis]
MDALMLGTRARAIFGSFVAKLSKTVNARRLALQVQALMPLSDGFLGVVGELQVVGMPVDFHPGRPGVEHQVGVFRRYRQRRVDGRGEGMDQLRPLRAEQPQPGAAAAAEMPFGAAAPGAFARFPEQRVVDRDVLAAADFQAGGIAAEVDRIPAAALGLAADRAVAALIRVGVGAVQAEVDSAAMAGTFELHDDLRRSMGYDRQPSRCRLERSPWALVGAGLTL